MRVLYVHNAKAGSGEPSPAALLAEMERQGYQVHSVPFADDWAAALARVPDIVAVSGGDGTVARVARVLRGRSLPIAVLPTGIANNIALALGLPDRDPEAIIRGWSTSARTRCDLGVAYGPWGTFHFLEAVGIGLLCRGMLEIDLGAAAFVNRLDDNRSRLAAARRVLTELLLTQPPWPIELRLDGVVVSGEYLLLEILNIGSVGPRLSLAPAAHPGDGFLDVVMTTTAGRTRLLDALQGRAPGLPVRRAQHIEIRCPACAVHVDDTLWTDTPDPRAMITIELSVSRAAATFLVPGPGTPRAASHR